MGTIELHTRNLKLIDPAHADALHRPWLFVHSIRTGFLVCILLIAIIYQVHVGNFLNIDMWVPIYSVLLVNFLLNSIYLFMFDRLGGHAYWNALLFGIDTLAITLLIYFTGTGQSLFLFLYLVNLILGGVVFGRDGGWLLTIWTSICFSVLLIFSPEVSGQSLYFSLFVNNLAFFAITALSGRLSTQLTVVGTRLQEVHSDLRILQNLNDSIVTNITTGIVVTSRTGFVQFFNEPSARILVAERLNQLKILDIIPELHWPWPSLVENEGVEFERREIQLKREDQPMKYLEIVATRLREGDGKVKGWLFLIDDRTDQKYLEENMRQQEKMAAVGQLAAGIAHEIRNPLASISGSVQLMMGNTQKHDAEDLQLMQIVDKEINRLNGLITEFLEYVRPEDKATETVDLNGLIREVIESLKFNSKLRQDIEQKLDLKAVSVILGNRDKLKQALLNFMINAYQAMDKVDRPILKVQTFDQPDQVILIIEDNGSGIKPENLRRIFEPFHTTKPSGTGLGLAVTHKILQAHGARVEVESEVGKGTKFIVEFPSQRDFHTEGLIPLKAVSKG